MLGLFDGLDLDRTLGFEGVALAVAAVLIAIQHSNELKGVADELRGVARSVPTRGIGIFPSYLSEVPGLISRATENITILCDTPAHGAFSNTAAFIRYWQTLCGRMIEGDIKIECTFFDADGRRQLHEAQIKADSKDWKAWKKRNRKNCEAFDQLAKKHGVEPPPLSDGHLPVAAWADTPQAYVESMMAINKAVLSSFDGSLKVEQLPFKDPLHEGPTIYFWRRDYDQEAVFVIVPVPGIGVRDLAGFHTREPELIRALGTVFEHPGKVAGPRKSGDSGEYARRDREPRRSSTQIPLAPFLRIGLSGISRSRLGRELVARIQQEVMATRGDGGPRT